MREFGVGSDQRPHDERDDGDDDDGRHEDASDFVGHALDGGAGALRVGDHGDDPGEHGVAADLLGAHDQGAAAVDGAADDGVSACLGHGHGFPGDQGLVDC